MTTSSSKSENYVYWGITMFKFPLIKNFGPTAVMQCPFTKRQASGGQGAFLKNRPWTLKNFLYEERIDVFSIRVYN